MNDHRKRLPRLPLRDARCVALHVLLDCQRTREISSVSLERALREAENLDPRDAGLAREMVAGCIRRRLTLDCLIDPHLRRAPSALDAELREILRLAVYQCLWLDRVPNRAAVSEAVTLARALAGDGPARMVNAVMRALLERVSEGPPDDQTPPTAIIPIDADRVVAMRRPYLPDPTVDMVAYLAMATSHPLPLVNRWIRQFGAASAAAICHYGASRPHQWLRPNALRITAEALAQRLLRDGVTAKAHDDIAVRYLAGPPPVSLAAFAEGLCQPQDLTAISVLRTLAPKQGEVIIDYCAGVGTKTAVIGEMAQNHATVIATDRDGGRLELARRDFERLGVTCVQTVGLDALPETLARVGPPDAILLDVPCSNTGVLARRPDARYRVDGRRLTSLKARQSEILERAARLADDRTRIVYSTCSLEPEENEQQLERFVNLNPGWRVTEQWLTLPSAAMADAVPRDGGYCAVVRRITGDGDATKGA
jgi:16S rRNA (cytosine967-C5)-methyltransferase